MLYEVTLYGTYYGQQTVNRWNYVSTGTPAAVLGSFALISAMGFIPNVGVYDASALFGRIRTLLNAAQTFSSVVARACANYAVTDFYERPFVGGVACLASGEGMSPTQAYGFRTNRVRLDIDRGTKRFAGVSEATTGNGGSVDGSALANAGDLANLMSQVLTYDDEGNTISFSPAVVSKDDYITPSGKTAYRYYPTLTEQLEHTATGVVWQPYTQVRTQVSRQYGRGN